MSSKSPLKRRKLDTAGNQLSISSFFASKPSRNNEMGSNVTEKDELEVNMPFKYVEKANDKEKDAFDTPDLLNKPSCLTKEDISTTLKAKKGKKSLDTAKFRFDNVSQIDSNTQSEASDKNKEERKTLHEKWVRKIGTAQSVQQPLETDADSQSADVDEAEEADVGDAASLTDRFTADTKDKTLRRKPNSKLTPLEKQFVDLKRKHGEKTVLVVEVGYKFRFFGLDAQIAAKELHIYCSPGRTDLNEDISESIYSRFAGAMIPVPRLMVGVVRQIETAALKAVGSNKSTVFERKLTNLYTKGTFLDDFDVDEGVQSSAPATGFIMSFIESVRGGSGSSEKVVFCLLAVQPSTGELVFDEFEDGFMRSEFETRLLHLQPCEILILGNLSKVTSKTISLLSQNTSGMCREGVRVEHFDILPLPDAKELIKNFYAEKEDALEAEPIPFSGDLEICLCSMITYLKQYGLENALDLKTSFSSFAARSTMLLNANTLASLEIYRNGTDLTEIGSLFWLLDHTRTKFGHRMLRKWIGRPLLQEALLQQRIAAVQELHETMDPKVDLLKKSLSGFPDIEKGLCRIHYGKCSRSELVTILRALLKISTLLPVSNSVEAVGFSSCIINQAIFKLPSVREDVRQILSEINQPSALKNDKFNFFRNEEEQYENIMDLKHAIAAVESDFSVHLAEVRSELKRPSLKYITVADNEYLIELRNSDSKLVPKNWIKINGTRSMSRYRSPEIIGMMNELAQGKERLAIECDNAYAQFLERISQKYSEFRDVVQSVATLDCLLSLATVAARPGYCKPTFVDEVCIDIVNGRHPMVEQMLLDSFVPNDIIMDGNGLRTMVITGPNMGGKSSFVRQTALIQIMGQIGSYVPAETATLGIVDALFTRMGVFDNMLSGESTFMVELHETADIIKQATPRSLVILDELGRGTSTMDGAAIAHAVLTYFITTIKSLMLFITHYPSLAQFADQYPTEVGNFHMSFLERVNEDESHEITFLHKLVAGQSQGSYGLNVAKLAGLPSKLIQEAAFRSKELEQTFEKRQQTFVAHVIGKYFKGTENIDVEMLYRLFQSGSHINPAN